jgi:hypothetical protein
MNICKWCGKEFIKKHNREMYCSHDCRHYAKLEQNSISDRKQSIYNSKYHIQTYRSYKKNLGTIPVSVEQLKAYKQSF